MCSTNAVARELVFYAFSMATWRSQRDALVQSELSVSPACIDGALEDPRLSSLVKELLKRGQVVEHAPDDAARFWYALSQICVTGHGAIEDDVSIATERLERIVVRYLDKGRPLFGDALDRHSIYGWIEHGDETAALERIIASPAWAAYVAPGRYAAKAVPAFELARETARVWVVKCMAAGSDIFFSSYPIE